MKVPPIRLDEQSVVSLGLLGVIGGIFYWLISSIVVNSAAASQNAKGLTDQQIVVNQLVTNYTTITGDIAAMKATLQAISGRQDRMGEYLRDKLK